MKQAYTFAAISIFLWSTVATVAKLLLGSLNSFQVMWASVPFAALFLLVVNILTGNIHHLKKYKLKDYAISVMCGIPGTFLYYVFYYSATAIMPASQAFIVNYLWPIMSVVFACILLKEKLTVRKGIAIFMSFLGVVIVTGSDIAKLDYTTIIGSVLCIVGAVFYGLFTALTGKFPYNKTVTLMLSYTVTF
ncbi:MAG: DMT family transporter, partial [Clostridia bacterium]|nr:DMT family transporter [Clostridia bacterium]